MTELGGRVKAIVALVLECEADQLSPEAGRDRTERWDSLAHMNLMLTLEEEFDVSFSDKELAELATLARIVAAVQSKLEEHG